MISLYVFLAALKKVICLPCEIQHREFDSKLILANRLAQYDDVVVLLGYDKYFGQILRSTSNCFLLDKSMSTLMLNNRIAPCKERAGIVFVNDEEGVNDLDETPEALDIRADKNAVQFIDKYFGALMMQILQFATCISFENLNSSHRYDF